MTFLILKMAAYLVAALLLGIVAGWVSRHVTAQRETETTSRALNDNRAKVPQLESLIRVRDEEINRLKVAQEGQGDSVAQVSEELQEQVALVHKKELEVTQLKAQLENLQSLNSDAADDMSVMIPAADAASTPIVDGELDFSIESSESTESSELTEDQAARIVLLEARIETLELELVDAQFDLNEARANTGIRDEMEELTKRLRQKAQDFDRLNREMEGEKRKVSELERERELQDKSLQVLHQQLEMERSSSVAPASTS